MLRTAVADTLDEVRPMLLSMAQSFQRSAGGELDDWLSDATLAYLKALNTYELNKGEKFSSWVGEVVMNALRDRARKMKRKKMQVRSGFASLEYVPGKPEPYFDWRDFADGLSDDAASVVEMVFETPLEISRLLVAEGGEQHFRGVMRRFLMGLGWSCGRVSRAYKEIQGAL